jgi:nitrile hydratase subunit alpha
MGKHDTHDHHHAPPEDIVVRVKALENLLLEKGLIDPKAMDELIDQYEHKIGPHIGARVVAKAWIDQPFKMRLLADADAALLEVGAPKNQGEHMVALENTPAVHNVVVCTLCSCYPWGVLGLPPVWYKSVPYRSQIVKDPRDVLSQFGFVVDADREVRVWDSTAELRYMVIPMRPPGTAGWSEQKLAQLVSRDSMIGVCEALPASSAADAGAA